MKTAKKGAMVAIGCLLAVTPIEFLGRYSFIAGTAGIRWLVLLNLGPYLQAGVALAFLTTLRSYLRARPGSAAAKGQSTSRLLFAAAGAIAGLVAALMWWEMVHVACRSAGEESCIFSLITSPGNYYLWTVADALAYYRYFALPCALLSGVISTHLVFGWPAKERLFSWSPPFASRTDLVWFSCVIWLIFYRALQFGPTWVSSSATTLSDGLFLNMSTLWGTGAICLPVSIWLASRIPKTRRSSIVQCQIGSLLIVISAAILLLPLAYPSLIVLQICVLTLNIGGFAWGWFVGDLRWRSLQLPK